MIRTSIIILTGLVFDLCNSYAQEVFKYQIPPSEIVKIVDPRQAPSLSVSPYKKSIILIA